MVEIAASVMEGSSHRDVVLASGSQSRRRLLTAAGLTFRIVSPEVDEAAIHQALHNGNEEADPSDVAELLARAKAEEVGARVPAALVIGADQVLSLDGRIFDKPTDRDAVRDSLLALRGKTHQLHSAVALAEGGQVTWSHIETAHLTMRAFSPEFLGRYLAAAGPQVYRSVVPYQLDGLGIQLFDRIEGDYFAILGLPILLLFGRLRESQVLGA
jgi:nucleoside triphosphate pyrophosphatase